MPRSERLRFSVFDSVRIAGRVLVSAPARGSARVTGRRQPPRQRSRRLVSKTSTRPALTPPTDLRHTRTAFRRRCLWVIVATPTGFVVPHTKEARGSSQTSCKRFILFPILARDNLPTISDRQGNSNYPANDPAHAPHAVQNHSNYLHGCFQYAPHRTSFPSQACLNRIQASVCEIDFRSDE